MPKPTARKRHMKKVIDRWENEGGTLPDVPASLPKSVLPDPQPGKEDEQAADDNAKTTQS